MTEELVVVNSEKVVFEENKQKTKRKPQKVKTKTTQNRRKEC